MWFSVVCILIENDTRHHSGQNVVNSLGCASSVHNILTTVMTRIIVDKRQTWRLNTKLSKFE